MFKINLQVENIRGNLRSPFVELLVGTFSGLDTICNFYYSWFLYAGVENEQSYMFNILQLHIVENLPAECHARCY
jgi:hypothetical protein